MPERPGTPVSTRVGRACVFAGGFVSFEASCGASLEAVGVGTESGCENVLDERETTDAGILFGAGADIALSDRVDVVIDGRYSIGLLNLDSEEGLPTVKSRVWSVTGGLSIPIG